MPDAAATPLVRRFPVFSALLFGAIAFLFFVDVLFSTSTVISRQGLDLTGYYLPVRAYGFGEMRQGHFPQWNPYTFSGTPYAANFQSALFYPINAPHLVLPVVTANNWITAIHFFLAGWFTSLWAKQRGNSVAAALLAGVIFMFSGGYFLHLYPGHVTILAAMCWTPLIFLCIDRALGEEELRGRGRWVLLGALAVGMATLAGHPQAIYYTALAAGVYVLIRLRASKQRGRDLGILVAMFAMGWSLAGVQLIPGIYLSLESTRQGGTAATFAREFALAPENLLTAIMPSPMGDMESTAYVGRFVLWESSIYVGAAALVLAIIGARRDLAIMALACLVLAISPYTPLYELLYRVVPGFSSFRATGRFAFLVDLFLAMMAAEGVDALARAEHRHRRFAIGIAVAAVMLGVMGAWLGFTTSGRGAWSEIVQRIAAAGESLGSPTAADPIGQSVRHFMMQSFIAAGVAMIAATFIAFASRKRAGYALGLVAVLELFATALMFRPTCTAAMPFPAEWRELARSAGDGRMLTNVAGMSNAALVERYFDAYGYDPILLSRYARLLAISQRVEDENTTAEIRRVSPPLRMLRVKYLLYTLNREPQGVALNDPLPRVLLVNRWQLKQTRAEFADALLDPALDPTRTVLLESAPNIEPDPNGAAGTLAVLNAAAESLEVSVDLPAAAILLVTDSYARGWTVKSMESPPASQASYQLMPANVALRAIPLSAGKHHLRMEYKTPGLLAGALVSGITAVFLVVGICWALRKPAFA